MYGVPSLAPSQHTVVSDGTSDFRITAVMHMARVGFTEHHYMQRLDMADSMLCLLLDHGADMNFTNEHWGIPLSEAYHGTTLHWASSKGHANVAQVLLENGADIDALSDFGTPLYRVSDISRSPDCYLGMERTCTSRHHVMRPHCRSPHGRDTLKLRGSCWSMAREKRGDGGSTDNGLRVEYSTHILTIKKTPRNLPAYEVMMQLIPV